MSKPLDPRKVLVARNLERFRAEVGMSQADAAVASGIPLDNIRRYEKSVTFPDAITLEALCRAYGHEVGDVFKEDPPPANPLARPAFLLRVTPGMEVNPELLAKLQSIVDDANRDQREMLEKKRKPRK